MRGKFVRIVILASVLPTVAVIAQAQKDAPRTKTVLKGMSANVAGAGEPIEVIITRWASDGDREKVANAWTNPGFILVAATNSGPGPDAILPPAPPAEGRGRGQGGRAGAPAGDAAAQVPDAAQVSEEAVAVPPAAPAAVQGARGDAAGRAGAPAADGGRGQQPAPDAAQGGRGRGRGAPAAPAAPPPPKPVPRTPENALITTLKELPDAGYIWTSDVSGYAIRYAYKQPLPGGGTRIILLTDRRLGAGRARWALKPPAAANAYEFSLIELRLPAKGPGEGKASFTGTVRVDPATKELGLENYQALPVVLRSLTPVL